jgi:Kef-type K+ transport system membrane component KefB
VIEEFARAHSYTAAGQIVLIVVAVVETAGVLFLVALMPCANGSSRSWATLYVVGAAILSAVVYYFPFDASS